MNRVKLAAVALIIPVCTIAAGYISDTGGSKYTCPDCNILMVSVEPMAAHHMSVYGYRRNTTPYLDSLADDSFVFNRAYTQAGNTLPATYSTFTSLYPSQHGVSDRFDPQRNISRLKLLSEVLRQNGYYTAGFTGHISRGDVEFNQGFDTRLVVEGKKRFKAVNRTLDRIDDRKFFMYYQSFQTHEPYFNYKGKVTFEGYDSEVREKMMEHYRNASLDANFFDLAKRNREHTVAMYDAELRNVDSDVRRLVKMLERRGLEDETVIIFTSQHGEMFEQHGEWGHGELWNEIMRIPLLIHYPGQEKSKRINYPVELIDLSPTVLDIAGIEKEFGVEKSKSLLPLFKDEEFSKDYVFAENRYGEAAFIEVESNLKYYWNHVEQGPSAPTTRGFVFNLTSDFEEENPIENSSIRSDMEEKFRDVYSSLKRFEEEGGRTWPYFD